MTSRLPTIEYIRDHVVDDMYQRASKRRKAQISDTKAFAIDSDQLATVSVWIRGNQTSGYTGGVSATTSSRRDIWTSVPSTPHLQTIVVGIKRILLQLLEGVFELFYAYKENDHSCRLRLDANGRVKSAYRRDKGDWVCIPDSPLNGSTVVPGTAMRRYGTGLH